MASADQTSAQEHIDKEKQCLRDLEAGWIKPAGWDERTAANRAAYERHLARYPPRDKPPQRRCCTLISDYKRWL